MVRKILISLILLSLLAVPVFIGACGGEVTPPGEQEEEEEEEVFNWRWQCCDVPGETEWEVSDPLLEQLIEEGSGGRVQIERYPYGMICGMDEMIGAVTMGTVEMINYPAGFASGIVPSSLLSEMPMGVRDGYDYYELHHVWGMLEVQREEYAEHGLYLLAPQYCGVGAIDSTFPINTLDDLNGKLIWLVPTLLWIGDFGAAPTEVPDYDMYMATRLGTIDGFWWPYKGLKDYKHMEVVNYVMLPRLGAGGLHAVVSLDTWNALGPELQMSIQNRIDAHVYEAYTAIDEFTEIAMDEAKEYGVQFITLSDADVAKLSEASRAFWDEVAGLSPAAAEATEIYKDWMEYREIPW